MAYQMAATVVTFNDLEGQLSLAGLFKCNLSNIRTAFCTISTDSMLALFLCISRASCSIWLLQNIHRVSKTVKLFLSELRQISTNFW